MAYVVKGPKQDSHQVIDVRIDLPPGQVVAHGLVGGVQHSAPVEQGRALQRHVRQVRGPQAYIVGREAGCDQRHQLGAAPACACSHYLLDEVSGPEPRLAGREGGRDHRHQLGAATARVGSH